MTGTISKDECLHLNELLGTKTPSGCFALSRNSMEDPFTVPSVNKFEGKDELLHRNSWLMPVMARRMTRTNKYHVGQWRQDVVVNATECNQLRELLASKLPTEEVNTYLPKACQKM